MSNEPYVVYQGFSMGQQPKAEALSELQSALCEFEKVVILIDDSCFAERVYDYLRIGRSCLRENEDETLLQRACFLSTSSELIRSLPRQFSHPALVYIRQNFVEKLNYTISPSLIKTQLQRWGLNHSRIIGLTKLELEFRVDNQTVSYQVAA